MPKPTRTPERISHYRAMEAAMRFIRAYFKNEGKKPEIQIPCRPDEDDDIVLCSYIRQQEFSDNPSLQSPAGEWWDISTAPKSPERFDAYARYYSNLGKKWLYRRIPDCVMHHQDTDFVCRPDDYREWEVTHWHTIPLPPAPTGEG